MSTGGDKTPKTRYVGEELFKEFDTLREEVGIPWEQEWSEIVDVEREDQSGSSYPEAMGDEEDVIPF